MKSKQLLLLFMFALFLPHTSAFNGLLRLKIIVFGEFKISDAQRHYFMMMLICNSYPQPDLGLFLFDVGSDIYIGNTFIEEGNPVWGTIIIVVMFLPVTLWYIGGAISHYRDKRNPRKWKIFVVICALIFAPLAIPALTVAYIFYIAIVFAGRCFKLGSEDLNPTGQLVSSFLGMKFGSDVDFARNLKLTEAVAEANLQAVLGKLTFPLIIS